MVAAADDLVWRAGADTSDFETAMLRSASTVEALERATKGDFQSGLVRALERIREESDLVTGKVTAVDQAVARMASKGASPEMLQRFREESEAVAKAKEDQANKAADEAAKEKQRVADVARLKIEQEKLVESQKAAQQRRDEQNVARQMALYAQAQAVKESLLTKEERVQREIVRLQDLKNRGLLTEQQLQTAVRNTQSAGAAQGRGGGGGVPRGLVVQQGVIGIQDAMTGYQVNGWSGAVMAGGNNAIQMASMVNPLLGSAAAIGVMAAQIGIMVNKGADASAKMKADAEAIKRATEIWGKGPGDRGDALAEERNRIAQQKDQYAAMNQVIEDMTLERQNALKAAYENAIDYADGVPVFQQKDVERLDALDAKTPLLDTLKKKAEELRLELEAAKTVQDLLAAAEGRARFSRVEIESIAAILRQAEKESLEAKWRAAEMGLTPEQQIAEEKKEARFKRANEFAERAHQAAQRRRAEEEQWEKARKDAAEAYRRALDPTSGIRSELDRLAEVQATSFALTDDELTRTLRLMAGQFAGSGTTLLGSASYGSVESVSTQNRIKEEAERQRMLDVLVEKFNEVLRELRGVKEANRQLEQNLNLEAIA